jgi:hypothetical protein
MFENTLFQTEVVMERSLVVFVSSGVSPTIHCKLMQLDMTYDYTEYSLNSIPLAGSEYEPGFAGTSIQPLNKTW